MANNKTKNININRERQKIHKILCIKKKHLHKQQFCTLHQKLHEIKNVFIFFMFEWIRERTKTKNINIHSRKKASHQQQTVCIVLTA